MKRLRTVEQVFNVLGGTDKVAAIADAQWKVAWHWRGKTKQFPAHTYLALQSALSRRGYRADDRLWSMTMKKKRTTKRAA